ncbi:MAG TPA: hypothetical protein VM577_03470 [Anaerovoracaceae bacterium]|nr:hypothetical protein [Anaerovoracaceae bacterium]
MSDTQKIKRLGVNQQAIQTFDEVFIKGNLVDQIHAIGEFDMLLTYRKGISPDRKLTTNLFIIIKFPKIIAIGNYATDSFAASITDFGKPLNFMNKYHKQFRETFMSYARYIQLSQALPEKTTNQNTRKKKI